MSQAPIRYTLRFNNAAQHYVEVEALYPVPNGRAWLDLSIAVWTPGSYMVREYARHVEAVAASAGGKALQIAKVKKNHWRVDTAGASEVTLRYRVYGHEMTVRTNWIESGFALLNGAPTFITLADVSCPHDVRLELPAGWTRSLTGLTPHPDGAAHHYRAADYDMLVDSPILAGNPSVHEFAAAGKPHVLANLEDGGLWDGGRAAADVAKIVEAAARTWRVVPYERYLFINAITEGRGGLEHHNSTILMTSRWAYRSRKDYVDWLGLASHELFHAWNVKRLRPVGLGPFDYDAEVYTPSLWIVEGFTAYYDDLIVHRAGLSTRAEYFERLSKTIEQLQTTPGRKVQPLETASFDAWIKHYRPDENSNNTSISYYTKGAVVAFLLDAKIRVMTRGTRSLDDVLRAAYARYAGDRGYTPQDFRAVIEEVAQGSLSAWLDQVLTTTAELDYREALATFGLQFKAPKKDDKADEQPKGWLGASFKGVVTSQVPRETPAYAAGLNAEDELLAIDEFRVTGDVEERLKQYRPGSRISLLVARRQKLVRLEAVLGEKPVEAWKLEEDPKASDDAKRNLEAWLSPGDAYAGKPR